MCIAMRKCQVFKKLMAFIHSDYACSLTFKVKNKRE